MSIELFAMGSGALALVVLIVMVSTRVDNNATRAHQHGKD